MIVNRRLPLVIFSLFYLFLHVCNGYAQRPVFIHVSTDRTTYSNNESAEFTVRVSTRLMNLDDFEILATFPDEHTFVELKKVNTRRFSYTSDSLTIAGTHLFTASVFKEGTGERLKQLIIWRQTLEDKLNRLSVEASQNPSVKDVYQKIISETHDELLRVNEELAHVRDPISTDSVTISVGDIRPPTITIAALSTVLPGQTFSVVASVSDDSGVAAVQFYKNGLQIGSMSEPEFAISTTVEEDAGPGDLIRFDATATDVSGNKTDAISVFTTVVDSSFALARTRTIDEVGHPLGNVTISEVGPNGEQSYASDSDSGLVTLGHGPGEYTWRFSAEGYLPTWRRQTLPGGIISQVPNPWLTLRNPNSVSVSPISGGTINDQTGTITVTVEGGQFTQTTQAVLTSLHGQNLPALLPIGWRPLAAFWLELDSVPEASLAINLVLDEILPTAQNIGLVIWDASSFQWKGVENRSGSGSNELDIQILGEGAYALVINDDLAENSPLLPNPGELLQGATIVLPDLSRLTATGVVDPAANPASLDLNAVTAEADVLVTHTEVLPSGVVFRGDVREVYTLAAGAIQRVPDYEVFTVGYKAMESDDSALRVNFPVRPTLIFAPEELAAASITIDLLASTAFTGGVMNPNGGEIRAEGIQLIGPPNAVDEAQIVGIRTLDPDPFTAKLDGFGVAILAVLLEFNELNPGHHLSINFPPQSPDTSFVLVRILLDQGFSGFQPIERFASDGNGNLMSIEPAGGDRLSGITQGGTYLLIKLQDIPTLVAGVARNDSGDPEGELLIQVLEQPWQTLSGANGHYATIARPGEIILEVSDQTTGNIGQSTVQVSEGQPLTNVELSTVPTGPKVIAIAPVDGATGVSRVTPISIKFSEPVKVSSLFADGIQLLDSNNTPVDATISSNLQSTVATVLPNEQLAPETSYTIKLEETIVDPSDLPLEGQNTFTFTTVGEPIRGLGAQLISYEPGSEENPCMGDPGYDTEDGDITCVVGTQGVADPDVPVSLVNLSTGSTATVISNADGSFRGFIRSDVDDFISATFINANETRIEIPVNRQLFDDGRVGLYKAGGILEAESDGGPVEVIIEPGAIPERTRFLVNSINLSQILELTRNTPPQNAQLIPRGLSLFQQGDELEFPADIGIPVTEEELNLPDGMEPEDGIFGLCTVMEVNGKIVYHLIDDMDYKDGKLVTNSPLFVGPLLLTIRALWNVAELGFLSASFANSYLGNPLPPEDVPQLPDLNPATTSLLQISMVIISVPLSRKVKVQGTVYAENTETNERFILPGAVVTLRSDFLGLNPLRGRLDAGAVFSVSGPQGFYSLIVDSPTLLGQAGFVNVSGTHPQFFGKRAAASVPIGATAAFAFGDLIFRFAPESETDSGSTPPFVSSAHTPALPGVEELTTLTVRASHGSVVPEIELPLVEKVVSLVPGIEVSPTDVLVSGAIDEELIGETGIQKTFTVTSTKAVVATLKIAAFAAESNPRVTFYPIVFGGAGSSGNNEVEQIDFNDTSGPQVIQSWPSNNAVSIAPGQEIRLRFNEPIDQGVENDPGVIEFSPFGPVPNLELTEDQRELSIRVFNFDVATDYRLTISSSVRDLAGNVFDQNPETLAVDPFFLDFRTAPAPSAQFPGLGNGAGVVISGIYAYALDRDAKALFVYDLSIPESPTKIGEHGFPDTPRDLALIPNYSYVTRPDTSVRTSDLIAVVGGEITPILDHNSNVQFSRHWLRILDVSDPTNPTRLAARNVTNLPAAVVPKVVWLPPNLVYLQKSITCDTGPENVNEGEVYILDCTPVQELGLVNLQAMIIGDRLSQEEFIALSPNPTPGNDLNSDGDFVDENETLPFPGKAVGIFAGKVGSIPLSDTTQQILDFNFDPHGGHLSVVLGSGRNPFTDEELEPMYRTLMDSGVFVSQENREAASFNFPNQRPKRLFTLFGVNLVQDDVAAAKNLAFISVLGGTPPENKIVVLDISNPLGPEVLTEINTDSVFGIIQSITQRGDGLLRVATSNHILLVDPDRLTLPVAEDRPHPALVGFIPNVGSGNYTLDGNVAGLNAVALGGNNRVVQTAPWINFVSLSGIGEVIHPVTLLNDQNRIRDVISRVQIVESMMPARFKTVPNVIQSSLDPPQPEVHYYVFVSAPGSTGETINLALESLNGSGFPLRNKGFGFPPVRAMHSETVSAIGQDPRENCDADIGSLKAYRLSSEPSSLYYNFYLSEPIALVYESLSNHEITNLKATLDREILWSGSFTRVSIDPSMEDNEVLGPFTSAVDHTKKVINPGVGAIAKTLPADYIMGPNPPPPVGHFKAPGTFGTVAVHSGEFRTETVDLALPSRRLPIVFERTIGGQDLYDGPFGRGWDFNYNQRLIELKGGIVLTGSKIPLILRGSDQDEIAEESDVMFCNGAGRTILYKFKSSDPPSEFVDDPLIQENELGWKDKATAWYLPPPGVFDMLVRLEDGQFARLTPDGMQYWYTPLGRLEKIYDRYPKNWLHMIYNDRGELTRIEDKSVVANRYLDIGYWRFETDELFDATIDMPTEDTYVNGKICRLKDYTDRDILFYYDECGQLIRREGPDVPASQAHEDGFIGRPITWYIHKPLIEGGVSNGVRGVTAGNQDGSPLVLATFNNIASSVPVTQSTLGAGGSISMSMTHENSAASLNSGGGKSTITESDDSSVEYEFNSMGLPEKITSSGEGLEDAETKYEYSEHGLVKKVIFPEGNSIEIHYDEDNANLRSRANVKMVKHVPGSRGGDTLTATHHYDSRFNLPQGEQIDFNENSITYDLFTHGRDVRSIQYGEIGEETFSYNEFGQIELHKEVDGVAKSYTYDASSGFRTSIRHGDLDAITFTYEGNQGARGLATSQILPRPESAPIEFRYDELDQLITLTRDEMKKMYSFNESGFLVRIARIIDEDSSLVETREYELNGFLKKTTLEEINTNGNSEDLIFQFVPDSAFRIKEMHLPGGEIRFLEAYDHLGNPHTMRLGDYEEAYTYDLNGNLRTVTIGEAVTEYIYDGHDRVISQLNPMGEEGRETIEYSYFGSDDRKTIKVQDEFENVNLDRSFAIDEVGRITSSTIQGDDASEILMYVYDGLDINISNNIGETIEIKRDSAGRIKKRIDSIREVSFFYDENNNVETIISSEDEGEAVYTSHFTPFDQYDHSLARKDDLGTIWDFDVRLDGVITRITNARDFQTTYQLSKLGEVLSHEKPNGIDFHFDYDYNRQEKSIKDASDKGQEFGYDDQLRRKSKTLRNNSEITFSDFNALNQPETINFPGGGITLFYDGQGRILSTSSMFNGVNKDETYGYDGLGRIISATYPEGTSTFKYDKLGPLREATYNLDDEEYTVSNSIRSDGIRHSITYPSGIALTQERDTSGRLISLIREEDEPIIQGINYAAAGIVETMILGNSILRVENIYDLRKRLLQRRYIRISDDAVLVEIRYVYDATDNPVAKQYVHRSARTDFFQFDSGDRLVRADLGVRPKILLEGTRIFPNFVVPGEISGDWSPGLYAREYVYEANGLDYIETVHEFNPDNTNAPLFVSTFGAPDAFLNPVLVDTTSRSSDQLGNTTKTLLQVREELESNPAPQPATFSYNAFRQLTKVERSDGVIINYDCQHNGLLFYRSITQGGITTEKALVYDDALLIEEYDRTGNANELVARYFYGTTDVPMAADLRNTSGALERFYYLTDDMGSVIALTDANGLVVERYHYDAWGQPQIELADSSPPHIARIVTGPGESLIVEFSERVLPPLDVTQPAGNLINGYQSIEGIITVECGDTTDQIALVYAESLAGYELGTALHLLPQFPLDGQCTLTLLENVFEDEWGNANSSEQIGFTFDASEGVELYENDFSTDTAPKQMARSPVGNRFLFHGQYFDYDAGLIYMRARFYDPFTGLFLQRDPHEYEDSVNLYAGFANNPVTFRDPTGKGPVTTAFKEAGKAGGKALKLGAKGGKDLVSQGAKKISTLGRKSLKVIRRNKGHPDHKAPPPPNITRWKVETSEVIVNNPPPNITRWTDDSKPIHTLGKIDDVSPTTASKKLPQSDADRIAAVRSEIDDVSPTAAPKSADDIALGLTRGRKGQPLLQPFADDLGAIGNRDWVTRGLADEGPFVMRFYQAAYRSTSKGGRIKFNVDDLDLNRALNIPRFSDPFDVGVTNWELQQILHNRQFYDATDFFIGTQKLRPKDVIDFGLGFRGR